MVVDGQLRRTCEGSELTETAGGSVITWNHSWLISIQLLAMPRCLVSCGAVDVSVDDDRRCVTTTARDGLYHR